MEETSQRQPPKLASKPCRNPTSSKLRASCDGCSLAKVKCDKQQPLCHRCANSGIVCHYSPSMRMGKTSAASRAAAAKGLDGKHRGKLATASSTRASSPSSISSANSSVRQTGFVDRHLNSPFYLKTPEYQSLVSKPCLVSTLTEEMSTGYHTDCNQYSRGFYTDDMFAPPADVPLPTRMNLPNPSTLLHHMATSTEPTFTRDGDMQNFFSASEMDSRSVDTRSPGAQLSSPASSAADSYSHDCMNLAKTTLNNLSLQSSNTSTSAYPSLPTVDQALTINKRAIEDLFILLCCPCPHDPHLPFIVAVIGSKVLAWYLAVARASATTPTNRSSRFANTETAVHMPLTLGAYKLDGEYDEQMKVQLVLGELRKVELLVGKFGERFCTGIEGDNSGVYSALETFLRSRLRETVEELRLE